MYIGCKTAGEFECHNGPYLVNDVSVKVLLREPILEGR